MKVVCKKSSLLPALQAAADVCSKRSPVPLAESVCFNADKNLTLKATDFQYILTMIIPESEAEVEEKGNVMVPVRILLDLVKKASDENIQLELKDTKLVIKSGKMKSKLSVIDETFPPIQDIVLENPISLPSDTWMNLIHRTMYATSPSGLRLSLSGINFSLQMDNIKAIATDSYRLAIATAEYEEGCGCSQIIIPSELLKHLIRLIENEDRIEMNYSEKAITFKGKNFILTGRPLTTNFPDCTKAIPKDKPVNKITVNRENIISVLKRASLFKNNSIAISCICIKDNLLQISAKSDEGNEYEEELTVQAEGEDITLYVNTIFLYEAIAQAAEENISIEFHGSKSPIVIGSEKNYIALVLPVLKAKNSEE